DLTNRLVLLLSPGVARAPAWGGAASPRAVSEPRLDAWVSTVLPDPGSVRCAVTYTEGGSPHTTHMTLAQLGLAPLDAPELRAALLEGSLYGGVGAIPVEPVASDAAATASLGDQRTSVARELGRRLTQAQNDDAAFDRTHATPERLRDHLVALLQTVFGRGF